MSKREIKRSKSGGKRDDLVAEAVAALRRRGVIGFPTETFYGLGADALDEEAVERVFALKGRDPNNPLPVIIADEEMLQSIVVAISPLARRLMERFWPGPLTLVLPGHARLPKPLVNRNGGVGVRISSHPLAQRLVKELGRPITATSANPSGQPPARSRAEVVGYFGSRVGIVIDGGKLTAEKGSTVVEVFAQGIRVIREGEIAAETLAQAARLDS